MKSPGKSTKSTTSATTSVQVGLKGRVWGFIQITRLDKPVGIGLLLWPTLASLWIAGLGTPQWHLLIIFTLGTILMRSAGCAINDFADRKLDGAVQRTQDRPLISGVVKSHEAVTIFIGLCLVSFILVLFTNRLTILLAVGGSAISLIYPFMKRYTHLPQLVLGIAFSWGIPMAFSAQANTLVGGVWLLYIANMMWIVMYDTQLAMVDREDDVMIGIKSTAILFANADKLMIGILQFFYLLKMIVTARQFELGFWFYCSLGLAALLFLYQQLLIRKRETKACFKAFRSNNWVGSVIFLGIVAHYL